MTMQDPASDQRSGPGFANWMYEQVSQIKAQMGRVQQQSEQVQAAMLDVNEKLRDAEGRIREMTSRTIGLPTMHDQLRQVSGLLERIQDAEVLIDTKFEILERQTGEERQRDQGERNDIHKRLQDLERRAENLIERQSSVEDATRRFHEDLSRANIQAQTLNQRADGVESRSARALEAIARLEQVHSEMEAGIRALRREDDVSAERVRLAQEVVARLETEMHAHQEDYRAVPLLAERLELLRAERQRLEDRTSRAEESLEDTRTRLERQEEMTAQFDTRVKSHDARIDHVHAATLDYRRGLSEQLLKLNQMLERMKRRRVEELERDAKELRVQSNYLKNSEE